MKTRRPGPSGGRAFWFLALGALWLASEPAAAQEPGRCRFLCAPDLALEPTLSVGNIAGRHRTATMQDGVLADTVRAETEAVFEVVLSMGIPTEIPWLALTLEVIWAPFAGTDANVFTGRSAEDLGRKEIGDNAVELEGEINLSLLTFEQTGGWADVHFDVVDQFGPAETPDAGGTYTHKLDLELDAAVAPFRRMGARGWLGDVELEGSLDYMVTGTPNEGDRFGDQVFLDDASRWSFAIVLVLPLAP